MEQINRPLQIVSILSNDPDKIEKYNALLQKVIPITKSATNKMQKKAAYDFIILLTLLEFEDESLKNCLGSDLYKWIDFVVKWKFHA